MLYSKADFILLPTTPTPAFKLGEKLEKPLEMYRSDIFTVSANLAGIPAISIPSGHTKNSLPIGMQLQAAYMKDENLLQAARYIHEIINN